MPGKSKIEWTDATWNPTTGCTHVSPGCEHCYAEALSTRFRRTEHPWTKPFEHQNVKLHPERLRLPLTWREPRRIFVDSMSDLFHELVPDDFIDQVFAVMAHANRHTYQVLTKRPERMRSYLTDPGVSERVCRTANWNPNVWSWPRQNVWLGTSVEDQRRAEERIPHLLATPAAIRFLSCEPLLGPLDLLRWLGHDHAPELEGPWTDDPVQPRLGWVIAGGESGSGHRPMNPEWVKSIRDDCQFTGTPFFFKQWGGIRSGGEALLDGVEHRAFPGCRVCGCTDDDCSDCVERTGDACYWVEPHLCSACARVAVPE